MQIHSKKIAVFGDLILDQYTYGQVSRISQEAPVPVIEVEKKEQRLGGAGNVLLNLKALQMDCYVFGRIGLDKQGDFIMKRLQELSIEASGMIRSETIATITKNRIVAANQQILRMDEECIEELTESECHEIKRKLKEIIEDLDAIVISDYGKGFLPKVLIKELIDMAKDKQLPVIVDPKGEDFSKYKGATVITPNYKESKLASPKKESIKEIALDLIEQAELSYLMITRSQDGLSLFRKVDGNFYQTDFPVRALEVRDVTGAGDTVVAVTAMGLANQLEHTVICQLCNLAGGEVVGHFGAATIPLDDLLNAYDRSIEDAK